MALKAIIESKEDVPESVRGEYAEKDGKFYLQVDEVDGYALEDVAGIRKVLDEVKAERGQLRKDMSEVDGEAGSLKRKIVELEASQSSKSKEKLETLKADLEELHRTEMGKITGENESLIQALEHSELTQKATLALTAAGFTKNGVNLLLNTEIKRQAKLVKGDDGYSVSVVNDKGMERSGKSGGAMDLTELAAELATNYPELVTGSQQTGPGVTGNTTSGGVGKPSITAAEYKALEPMQQSDHMAAGGVVT